MSLDAWGQLECRPAREKFWNTLDSLPVNSQWKQGSAPQERFEQLLGASLYLKEDAFEKLGKAGKDPDAIRQVHREFEALRNALEDSRPSYPSPNEELEEIKKSGTPGWAMEHYTISYHPGSRKNAPVRVVYNDLRYSTRDFDDYSSTDLVNNDLEKLIGGFKKMEQHVVKALNRENVDGLFGRGRLMKKAQSEYDGLVAQFSEIIGNADVVKTDGYTVEWNRTQGRYIAPSF